MNDGDAVEDLIAFFTHDHIIGSNVRFTFNAIDDD